MSAKSRDPEIIVKRAIVGVFALVALIAAGIGFIACLVAFIDTGHPILIVGIIGCLAGLVAGLYFARLAMSPTPRTF